MKKTLIISLILLNSLIGLGQTYKPFNFTNGQWNAVYHSKGGFPFYFTAYYLWESVQYYCNGDTIINDTAYNMLYYKGYGAPPWYDVNVSGYIGLIRNDSINKKVIVKDYNIIGYYYGTCFVLYDFNLNIGDTFRDHYGPPSVVNSIDSVMYCGEYHKRYNYSNSWESQGFLIEGIGSKHGLIPSSANFGTSTLSCYGERNSIFCDTCLTPSVSMINENTNIDFYFYPNPSSGKVNIQIPQQFGKTKTLALYNCIGELQLVQSDHISEIDISNLKRGLYYIVLTNFDNETLTRKIIKE
jgi:hypothetical protein